MALSSRERVLYARHLLLHEIGSAGQERLCATQVTLPEAADPGARAVAYAYLQRAGMAVTDLATHAQAAGETRSRVPGDPPAHAVDVESLGNEAAIEALAGIPELAHAARALRGAFAATEVIKRATGFGTPGAFPAKLCLFSEDV